MKFRSLIIKNIFRNKTRSLLAILGIAIGVATILGLGLVTNGLAASTQQALTADAADFTVIAGTTGGGGGPDGASGGGAPGGQGGQQLINQTKVAEIQQISGVGTAAGVLRTNVDLNDTNSSTNSTTTTTTTSTSGSSNGNTGPGQGNFRMMYSV